MKKKYFHSLLLVLLAAGLGEGASLAGDAWTSNWESIRDAASQIRSIRVDFVQRKQMKILKKPLISKGSLSYRTPDRLRWEYAEPLRQVLLVRGGTVRKYVMSNGRFVEDASGSVEAVSMVMEHIFFWLKGRFEKDDLFNQELLPGPPPLIVLKPIKAPVSRYIQRITIKPGKTPGLLERIEIEESDGSATAFEFSEARLNESLADSVFESVP